LKALRPTYSIFMTTERQQFVMDRLIHTVPPEHAELLQQQGSTRSLISNDTETKNSTPLHLQDDAHHPNFIQIAEKRLEQLLVCINKSKQSRVALERFESENRNDSCCSINNRLKKRIALIDSPSGRLEKRHKKESSTWTLTSPQSSTEKKLQSTRPVSPQNVRRHRTPDRVVQNKFDEKDIQIWNSRNDFN
jgi:hypothetical protein